MNRCKNVNFFLLLCVLQMCELCSVSAECAQTHLNHVWNTNRLRLSLRIRKINILVHKKSLAFVLKLLCSNEKIH